MKTMAEVLEAHSSLEWSFEFGGFICTECGWQETYAHQYAQDAEPAARSTHQEAVLVAAGFGLMADAKAEALEEAAAELDEGIAVYASNLRARAAALRGNKDA